jgi:hypothetical protein
VLNKVQLLLSLNESQNLNELVDLLVEERQAALRLLPEGSRHRRAIRVPDDPTALVPQDGRTVMATVPPSFDAFFELGGEDARFETLVAAVAGSGDRLQPLVDPARSAALVGTEHVIIPGSQGLLLVMALRRLPVLSPKEFHDFWLNEHAVEVGRSVPDLQGYRQFHADEEATRAAATAAGLAIHDLDGTAEGYYQDIDVFLEVMSRPEVTADAGFIDHSRSVMWLYELAE